jgi:hypothetical protein
MKSNIDNKTIQNTQQMPISSGADIGSKLLDKKVISEDQLNIALKERERVGNTRSLGVDSFHQILESIQFSFPKPR